MHFNVKIITIINYQFLFYVNNFMYFLLKIFKDKQIHYKNYSLKRSVPVIKIVRPVIFKLFTHNYILNLMRVNTIYFRKNKKESSL